MKPITIKPCSKLQGTITLPGDKSISHRSAILAAMAKGKTEIRNFLFCDDCLVTLKALAGLGIKIAAKRPKKEVVVVSQGDFKPPRSALWMGESGTSARILLGLLSGQKFKTILKGAPSLLRRPMRRVIEPLRLMGARIQAKEKSAEEYLPLAIFPSSLHGIDWRQKIPSAQVKSAILLAALYAKGETKIFQPVNSRDHTERMLKCFGADVKIEGNAIRIKKSELGSPGKVFVPGDISSAAFFFVAALLVKKSKILIRDVGVNPTRAGVLNVLTRMSGNIQISNQRDFFEPMADVVVSSSALTATTIKGEEIPALIDELPILMVAASLARGTTVIEGVQELRVKETDRISSMVHNLMKLGVNIRVKSLQKEETIEITGRDSFKGSALRSFGDHRTAMSMIVAALVAESTSHLDDISCTSKSFPGFWRVMRHLIAQ